MTDSIFAVFGFIAPQLVPFLMAPIFLIGALCFYLAKRKVMNFKSKGVAASATVLHYHLKDDDPYTYAEIAGFEVDGINYYGISIAGYQIMYRKIGSEVNIFYMPFDTSKQGNDCDELCQEMEFRKSQAKAYGRYTERMRRNLIEVLIDGDEKSEVRKMLIAQWSCVGVSVLCIITGTALLLLSFVLNF